MRQDGLLLQHPDMINIEINNMGSATQSRLMMDLMYPNLFAWPHFDQPDKLTLKKGFYTNSQTKPLLISNFKVAVMEMLYCVRSSHLLEEMSSYVIKNGQYAKTDLPSDRIMAAALSWACIKQTEFGYEAQVVMGSRANTKAKIVLPQKNTVGKIKERNKATPATILNSLQNGSMDNDGNFFIEDIFNHAFGSW